MMTPNNSDTTNFYFLIKAFVLLQFVVSASTSFAQVDKQVLNSNPNHIGGSEMDFNVILSDLHSYSPKEVHNAYLNKESTMFRADPDTLMILFQEHFDYLDNLNENELAGEALLSQAELLYMIGRIDGALPRIKKGISLLPDASTHKTLAYARLGSVYKEMSELDSAELYVNKFTDIVFETKDSVMYLSAYQLKGEIAVATNKYVTALDYYMEALKWSDQAAIPLRKSDVLQKIATIYVGLGDDVNAKKYLEQALKIAVDNNYSSMQNLLRTRLSHYEIRLKNYDVAIDYLNIAEPYFLEKKRMVRVLECRSLLAHAYLSQNQFELAKFHLNNAKEILEDIEIEQYKYIYYHVQGLYEFDQRNYTKAESYLLKAMQAASNPLKSNAYQSAIEKLIEVYNEIGDPIAELEFTKKYYTFRDSIFSLKQTQLIYDYEGRYQKAEQDLAIAQLNESNSLQQLQLSNKNKQLWLSLIGVLAFLLIAIVSVRAFLQKKKSADILQKKNTVIEKSLHANKMLLKEIHHRVKNNLQVVSSLLYLQSRFIKDDSAKGALNTGRARVQAMSILHQKLYKHDDIQKVEIADYFEELGNNLFNTYKLKDKQIDFKTTLDDMALDVDLVIPMGLIANELISNALKHAFSDKNSGFIHLSITRENGKVKMFVEDNGKGLPFDQLPEKTDSLGVELIKSFADKLNAEVQINNESGSKIQLSFDAPESSNREVLMYTESVAS